MYQSLFIHSPTERPLLLQNFGNYEWSCSKYPCAGFFVDIHFHLLWVNTKEMIAGLYGTNMFSSIKNWRTVFPKRLNHVALPPVIECSSTFLPAFGVSFCIGAILIAFWMLFCYWITKPFLPLSVSELSSELAGACPRLEDSVSSYMGTPVPDQEHRDVVDAVLFLSDPLIRPTSPFPAPRRPDAPSGQLFPVSSCLPHGQLPSACPHLA